MDNLEFATLVRRLGQDVAYLSIRFKKSIDKCISDFSLTGDPLKCCSQLAGSLIMVSDNATLYACNLEERIVSAGLEQEYETVLRALRAITLKKETHLCDHCHTASAETRQNGLLNEVSTSTQHEVPVAVARPQNSHSGVDKSIVINTAANPADLVIDINSSDEELLRNCESALNEDITDSNIELMSLVEESSEESVSSTTQPKPSSNISEPTSSLDLPSSSDTVIYNPEMNETSEEQNEDLSIFSQETVINEALSEPEHDILSRDTCVDISVSQNNVVNKVFPSLTEELANSVQCSQLNVSNETLSKEISDNIPLSQRLAKKGLLSQEATVKEVSNSNLSILNEETSENISLSQETAINDISNADLSPLSQETAVNIPLSQEIATADSSIFRQDDGINEVSDTDLSMLSQETAINIPIVASSNPSMSQEVALSPEIVTDAHSVDDLATLSQETAVNEPCGSLSSGVLTEELLNDIENCQETVTNHPIGEQQKPSIDKAHVTCNGTDSDATLISDCEENDLDKALRVNELTNTVTPPGSEVYSLSELQQSQSTSQVPSESIAMEVSDSLSIEHCNAVGSLEAAEQKERDDKAVFSKKLEFFKCLEMIPKPNIEDSNLASADPSDVIKSLQLPKEFDKELRQSLLKVVSNYFMRRRKNKLPRDDNSSSDDAPVRAAKPNRKRRRHKKKQQVAEAGPSTSGILPTAEKVPKRAGLEEADDKEDSDATEIADLESLQQDLGVDEAIGEKQNDTQTRLEEESGIVEPFKRNKVLPLPASEASEPSVNSSLDSELVLPYRRSKVPPLPCTQPEVYTLSSDIEEEPGTSLTNNQTDAIKGELEGKTRGLKRSHSESSPSDFDACGSVKKVKAASNSIEWDLDSKGRDGLLDLLDQHLSDKSSANSDCDGSDVQVISSDDEERVKGGDYRTELSADLDEHNLRVGTSLNSDLALKNLELNNSERDELVELLTESLVERHIFLETPGSIKSNQDNPYRECLLDLIREFEEALSKGLGYGNMDNLDVGMSPNSLTGPDTQSPLWDLLREESIEDPELPSKGPGRPKQHNKESWDAYQALVNDFDDDISSSRSTSPALSEIDWEVDQSGSVKEIQEATAPPLSQELRALYGINSELVVKVERTDFSGFDLEGFKLSRRNCDDTERLCNLTNILATRKDHAHVARRPARKRPRSPSRSSSSLSDLSLSDDEIRELLSDREATPTPESQEESRRLLVASLWDNIKSSSDEESDSSEASSTTESEGGVRKKKASTSDDSEDAGVREEDASSESGSGNDKTKVVLDSSDEEDLVGVRKGACSWRHDPILNMRLSTSSEESESEEQGPSKKRERKKKEINLDASDDNQDAIEVSKKKKKRSPNKIFLIDSDTSDDSDFEIVSVEKKNQTPQKVITLSDEDDDSPSKKGKGRRNIRALLQDEDLAEATQKAHNEERERIRRLEERNKTKETLSQSLLSEDDVEPLILDLTEDVEIKVHSKITRKLKPHQRNGIQFMWDSCYESVEQCKKKYVGSGCILAHCMGLGKTLQALGLIQALFSNPVTATKHVLVVCPLSTVSNWKNEYNLAYKGIKECGLKFHSIEVSGQAHLRFDTVNKWRKHGGMLVIGYECFGLLVNDQKLRKWESRGVIQKESILQALVDPGPDLVICDEGHLLRNKYAQRTLALNRIKTKRRIILTGTPLQNNLLEYYYMVNFVKPSLLGNEKEYKTNFINPIQNGQFEDSTAEDIMFMKKRTHVLHKILNRTVQRVEDTELKRYLPKLVDQAVFVKLSDLQVDLYNTYLDSANERPVIYTKSGQICRQHFLADVQMLQYICLHPNVLCTAEKKARAKAKTREQDVIDDNFDEELEDSVLSRGGWCKDLLSKTTTDLSLGTKMQVAVDIVREAAACGDKVLIFSHSHAEMDNLEFFVNKALNYKAKHDYFRMDGTVSPNVRSTMCDKFNDPKNKNIRLFIMSTRVGGLGLNLTAANRIIIMNVSWNPSYDTQSVFRAFRFGQDKAVFVYRLISTDTMEEKMYQKVVTKLAVAHRVVDKHQITRHYNSADIQEYYTVRPTADKERPVPNLPEDRILAKLIQKHKMIYRWHEHQALLANRPEEDLDEHQKSAAWEEFNKGSAPETIANPGFVPASTLFNHGGQGSQSTTAANIPGAFMLQGAPLDHTYSRPKPDPAPLHHRLTSAEEFWPPPPLKHARNLFRDENNQTSRVSAPQLSVHSTNPAVQSQLPQLAVKVPVQSLGGVIPVSSAPKCLVVTPGGGNLVGSSSRVVKSSNLTVGPLTTSRENGFKLQSPAIKISPQLTPINMSKPTQVKSSQGKTFILKPDQRPNNNQLSPKVRTLLDEQIQKSLNQIRAELKQKRMLSEKKGGLQHKPPSHDKLVRNPRVNNNPKDHSPLQKQVRGFMELNDQQTAPPHEKVAPSPRVSNNAKDHSPLQKQVRRFMERNDQQEAPPHEKLVSRPEVNNNPTPLQKQVRGFMELNEEQKTPPLEKVVPRARVDNPKDHSPLQKQVRGFMERNDQQKAPPHEKLVPTPRVSNNAKDHSPLQKQVRGFMERNDQQKTPPLEKVVPRPRVDNAKDHSPLQKQVRGFMERNDQQKAPPQEKLVPTNQVNKHSKVHFPLRKQIQDSMERNIQNKAPPQEKLVPTNQVNNHPKVRSPLRKQIQGFMKRDDQTKAPSQEKRIPTNQVNPHVEFLLRKQIQDLMERNDRNKAAPPEELVSTTQQVNNDPHMQSPLQKQIRGFMEQLHMMQKSAKTAEATAVEPPKTGVKMINAQPPKHLKAARDLSMLSAPTDSRSAVPGVQQRGYSGVAKATSSGPKDQANVKKIVIRRGPVVKRLVKPPASQTVVKKAKGKPSIRADNDRSMMLPSLPPKANLSPKPTHPNFSQSSSQSSSKNAPNPMILCREELRTYGKPKHKVISSLPSSLKQNIWSNKVRSPVVPVHSSSLVPLEKPRHQEVLAPSRSNKENRANPLSRTQVRSPQVTALPKEGPRSIPPGVHQDVLSTLKKSGVSVNVVSPGRKV